MGRHGLHAAPRRGGTRGTALRTGLLGVSVAVALGAAAVTTGMVPVGASFPYVGVSTTDTTVKTGAAKATPDSASESDSVIDRQGGLASLSGRGSATSSAPTPAATPPASPSASASASPSTSPSAPASPTPSASAPPKASPSTTPPPAPPSTARRTPAAPVPAAPVPATEAPKKTQAPAPSAPAPTATATRPSLDTHSAEEAAVVTLVNQERAQAGCGPVRANPPLAALAGAFSKDMAARGFFGHDDPEGNTPWDRAAKAGLSGLGGENIARGQGDAESVMRAWMNSPGHKANILNCEFRTLGVGAHFAAGGPWWTQDFGF
ncbi:CAP domain-containing protein [Streptomyces erythrochromogenes]|uniref:CAP domain-containing protein n=1 Tax=Streptomyces erythrochromogenes TaxID=285574 RepID=UPI00382C8833